MPKKIHIHRRAEEDQRAKQAVRMANILGILERLLQRSKWNVRSLAADLELSERTVHRYLEVLQLVGVPYYYDKNERCYRVRPGYTFPIANLTPDELLGQATATLVSEAVGLGPEHTARATTRKLSAGPREGVRDLLADAEALTAVLDLKLADHAKHRDAIKIAQWALVEGKQLLGSYRSPHAGGQTRQFTLHPYRLCLSNRAWYLIARPVDKPEPRTFRVARFESLKLIDQAAEIPEDFNLEAYFGNAWNVFRDPRTYDVRIEFTEDVADQVTETIWHRTQTVERHADGRVTLGFRVDGLQEIIRWVLGWTGRCRVIAPEELRMLVVEQLQAGLEMNAGVDPEPYQ